jgi:hypothetical protein
MGSGGISPRIANLDDLHATAALIPGKGSGTHRMEAWRDPTAGPCLEFNPGRPSINLVTILTVPLWFQQY